MTDATLKIEYLPVSALKPYKRNARKHSAAGKGYEKARAG